MKQAMSNPTAGARIPITMSDPRWPASAGWVKMTPNINGIEIHYVYNTVTGATDDFKFVN
jgi:filamentous hemagglutinin